MQVYVKCFFLSVITWVNYQLCCLDPVYNHNHNHHKAYTDCGGVYSTERNGTERNDGLNFGTECFLRLKLAAYHCCTFNSLPVIDLTQPFVTIKFQLTKILWQHFTRNFDPDNQHSFHFTCPCSICSKHPKPPNFDTFSS